MLSKINLTTIARKFSRSLLILTLGIATLGSVTAFVVVDCRPQSGKPANKNLCSGIIGGAGDSHISVEQDITVSGPFFGDGVIGNGGNDVMINNGTTVSNGGGTGENGDIEGDVATGNGGNDVIVNNGSVAGDLDGDSVFGNGGSDTIINNGTVGDDIDGDNAKFNGGDDLIINNGTVNGDIEGDDNTTAKNSRGGNDTIIIDGIVEGSVFGDFGVEIGGSDTIVLQNSANGGSDNELYLDGNDGEDTLVFNFVVPDQASLDNLTAQITNADPADGSLVFNGQKFTWANFEHLENQMTVAGTSGTTTISLQQSQVIIDNAGHIQAAFYCMIQGINVVGTDAQGRGEFLFTLKAEKITSALKQAGDNKTNVELGNADGQYLWTLPSGDLQLQDEADSYNFPLTKNGCGV